MLSIIHVFLLLLPFATCGSPENISACFGRKNVDQEQKTASSTTFTAVPIAKALREAMAYLRMKDAGELQPVNEEQKTFIKRYMNETGLAMLKQFSSKELWARASKDIDKLNSLLKEEGFNIELQKEDEDSFGVIAILKTIIEWKEKAKKTYVKDNNNKEYAAIELGKKHGCSIKSVENHSYPIACVRTKSNDTVYFTIADSTADGVALQDKVMDLMKSVSIETEQKFNAVVVPMVDIDVQNDISWLLGLVLKNGYFVSQAKQQTKFALNEKGARVESAAAFEVSRGISVPKRYVINKPFYAWIVREGASEPYFAAHIMPSDWKEPKA